jgi:hypothetical protein
MVFILISIVYESLLSRFMLVLNDFVSGPTILARVQLILSWFLFLNGCVYAPIVSTRFN